jgi:MFS family permease
MFITLGVGFYAFGVFFKPIQEEFNWGRGVTSVAFLIFYLVQAISSPFIGRLTDRLGPKKIFTLGGISLSVGLGLLSLTSNLPFFYVAYGILGIGCSAASMIPMSFIVSTWFTSRMGLAMGIVSAGMGAGGLVLPLVIGNYLIPSFGWRAAYQMLILVSLSMIIITQVVIKDSPKSVEAYSEKKLDEAQTLPRSSERLTPNTALKSLNFWLITGSFVMFQLAQVGTIQHLIVNLTDNGFPIALATTIFSSVNIASAGGKLLFGYMSDQIRAEYCAMIGFLLSFVATSVLIIMNPASSLLLIGLYILTMGIAIGCWAPISSILIETNFGMRNFGTIYGVFSLFFFISTGVSPTFFGIIYDATHQYYLAYVSALGFYAVATILILVLHRLKHS